MPLVNQNGLDEIRTSDKLPSPSGVALEILKLTRDENASSEKLGQVLVRDPALAGQILKYANSAQVRTGKEVKTVHDAVVRLGMMTVRQLALGFSLLSNARGGPCEAFDYTGFWMNSLAAAVGAQTLSANLRGVEADEAFTCGLLGQIGRLCLASVHAETYSRVLNQWDGGSPDKLLALERDAFSTDHNEIGAALLGDWGLPETFQEAVRYQEDPAGVQELPERRQTLPRLLYLAHHLASICASAPEARHELVAELLQRGSVLGLSEESVAARCAEALDEWQRLGEVLDIIVGAVPPIHELVERARGNLGAVSDAPQISGESRAGCLRIMVLRAAADARTAITEPLHEDGHAVTEAKDGQEALSLAVQSSPQVIISDWEMPKMNGVDLCAALRRSDDTARTYVILTAGHEEPDYLVAAFEAGVDDYLIKPVDPRILTARLRAAQRLIGLQERVERDREEIRRTAAQLGIANRKLEQAALYDELTSLPNRRFAVDRLEQEWARSERGGSSLVVMLLDIDHFKRVNDTFGHDAGDVVLRETAQAMKRSLRVSDVVCRFGGEEFLAICPDAALDAATMLGDRLRSAVETNVLDVPEFQGSVTVSVGIAANNDDVPTVKELLKLADEALYAAKEAGRNKVCYVGPHD